MQSTIIISTENAIYRNGDDFTDPNNIITPASTPTGGHWQFVNFNNKVVGAQRNHGLIVYDGGALFLPVTAVSGIAPVGGDTVCSAFGRLWVADDDEQTIKYSALLDETRWDSLDGGGQIDMSTVWTQGRDRVVCIKALGANLVVFGENHIIMWSDGQGSSIGLNPDTMYVVDTIEGTGCIARDSVQAIGEGDMAYLSRHGVQLLGRVIQNRANPVEAISANIKTYLRDLVSEQKQPDPQLQEVRATFHPEESFYLLHIPRTGVTVVFDTRQMAKAQNGDNVMRVTTWELGGNVNCLTSTRDGRLLFGGDGIIGKYHGTNDLGESFPVNIRTGWLDLGELNQRLKLLKAINTIVRVTGVSNFDYSWGWDFAAADDVETVTISYTGFTPSEYGEAEYGIGEFSGNLQIRSRRIPGKGTGQFIQISVATDVSGFNFILQQLQLTSKIGRLAV